VIRQLVVNARGLAVALKLIEECLRLLVGVAQSLLAGVFGVFVCADARAARTRLNSGRIDDRHPDQAAPELAHGLDADLRGTG
jgi:hypothetical protein